MSAGQEHFISDAITAVWSDGLFVETISGNLQIDEVKAIVDSIGG